MMRRVTPDQATVLAILGMAIVAFVSNRIRADLVALLVVIALATTGLCTPAQAVAGFGSTVVVMVAALLVVGEALARTGVANLVGDQVGRLGRGEEGRTRIVVVLAAGLLGSFMSSTAVVALFLPVVLRIAQENRIAPARLLLPLAYGALVSGMMTLIGTTPNLVVHAELRSRGLPGFAFFDFTPIGVSVLLLVVGMFAAGARLLLPAPPDRVDLPRRPRVRDLWRDFVPGTNLARLSVLPGSPLVGRTLRETELGKRHGIRVLAVTPPQRRNRVGSRPSSAQPTPDHRVPPGEVLTVAALPERLEPVAAELGLEPVPMTVRDLAQLDRDLGVAVVMVHPESGLIGRTIEQASFRTQHGLHVAGVRRDREALVDFAQVPLRAADTLLVTGRWSRIERLSSDPHDFVLLTLPAELAAIAPARDRMPIALAILAAMVAASASGLLPVVTSALAAAVLMVMTRCVPLADAYRSIHWGSVVLIAGMLPLAETLGRTGVLAEVVEASTAVLASAGPRAVLAALFVVTALLGAVVSNTATAVLMAPVAIGAAEAVGLRPEAFAMTVAIAASSAYLTPMSSPVVTLVVEPGGYTFGDFVRAGLPASLGSLAVCVVLVPVLLPF
jgi:di/tricarboxylate transporter